MRAPTKRVQQMHWMATQLGEPMKAGFDPLALSDDLDHIGLRLEENLDPATIEARYHAIEHFHYARAVLV